MRKYNLLLIICSILFICGCQSQTEQVIYTCKQDAIAPTYSTAFTYVIKTTDNLGISSIESSAIYNATYLDTDFTQILNLLKSEQNKYQQEYTDVDIDFDEKKEQIFFRVMIPINNHNLLIFQENNPDMVENGNLIIPKYKQFLEQNGYHCK